jgi:hypothetical protein|tara:strand:+ start:48 stop:1208 length:1161 start_codon:yes stop_codon:yes gene_type:complete
MEPTLVPDKDCSGVIGGEAVADDCGYCTGGTTTLIFNQYMGCDSACIGSKFDCNGICAGEHIVGCDSVCVHQDTAKMYDLCGDCIQIGAPEWNEDCKGCTNPNAACNSYDNTATVYEEGSCISPSYICETGDDGLLDITTITALTTDNVDCYEPADEYNCGPGESICKFFDCNSVPNIDSSLFIPCNPQLMLLEPAIPVDTLDIGNGECDYYGVDSGIILNITSCPEFDYDRGDCNLVDCRGVHFSDILCETEFESDPTIDTLINSPPDSLVIKTTTLMTYYGGCTDAQYSDITTIEKKYIYHPENDTTYQDTVKIGSRGWIGDDECDSEGYLFDNFGLDFNCVEFDFEGGDCYSLGRVNSNVRKKSRSKKLYQEGKIKINLNYLN